MAGKQVPTEETSWTEFALEEYKSLHAESLERVRNQNTFVSFSLIAGTAIISTSELWENSADLLLVNISFSFILWVVFLIFIEQEYQVALIGNYIKEHLYPIFGIERIGLNPCWELYRTNKLGKVNIGFWFAMAAKYAFLLVPMGFIDIRMIPSSDTRSIILVLKYLIVIFALGQTIREYTRPLSPVPTRESTVPDKNL
jgi:hypothetical protein